MRTPPPSKKPLKMPPFLHEHKGFLDLLCMLGEVFNRVYFHYVGSAKKNPKNTWEPATGWKDEQSGQKLGLWRVQRDGEKNIQNFSKVFFFFFLNNELILNVDKRLPCGQQWWPPQLPLGDLVVSLQYSSSILFECSCSLSKWKGKPSFIWLYTSFKRKEHPLTPLNWLQAKRSKEAFSSLQSRIVVKLTVTKE